MRVRTILLVAVLVGASAPQAGLAQSAAPELAKIAQPHLAGARAEAFKENTWKFTDLITCYPTLDGLAAEQVIKDPGPGNRDCWFFGWHLQWQATDSLALDAEAFGQTSNMVGQSASTGLDLGAVFDFTPHDYLLFSAGSGGIANAVNGPAVGCYSTTY